MEVNLYKVIVTAGIRGQGRLPPKPTLQPHFRHMFRGSLSSFHFLGGWRGGGWQARGLEKADTGLKTGSTSLSALFLLLTQAEPTPSIFLQLQGLQEEKNFCSQVRKCRDISIHSTKIEEAITLCQTPEATGNTK